MLKESGLQQPDHIGVCSIKSKLVGRSLQYCQLEERNVTIYTERTKKSTQGFVY